MMATGGVSRSPGSVRLGRPQRFDSGFERASRARSRPPHRGQLPLRYTLKRSERADVIVPGIIESTEVRHFWVILFLFGAELHGAITFRERCFLLFLNLSNRLEAGCGNHGVWQVSCSDLHK